MISVIIASGKRLTEGIKKLATGTPKAQWNGEKLRTSNSTSPTSMPAMSLNYTGKRLEHEILQTKPAPIKTLWQGGTGIEDAQAANRLYYGDNFPILASLLQESSIR